MSGQIMIEASALSKRYGDTRAVDLLTFQVQRGEVLGFLGPNGAGKTTTMRMLIGTLRPSEGEVRVAGIRVQDDPLGIRRRIGYLPENAPLYDEMMVVDFLRFTARMRELPVAEHGPRLKDTCERCGLMDVLGKDIGQLSKGYRQRVGLAQALLHDPDLLILDEPTSGLDPNQIVEIRNLIKDIGKEKTVILSTHILPEVQATCNRILIMNEGRLVADDSPDGLLARQSGSMLQLQIKAEGTQELDPAIVRGKLQEIAGLQSIEVVSAEGETGLCFKLAAQTDRDLREAVFRKVVAEGWILLDLHREAASLEEAFRRLTLGDGTPTQASREEQDHD